MNLKLTSCITLNSLPFPSYKLKCAAHVHATSCGFTFKKFKPYYLGMAGFKCMALCLLLLLDLVALRGVNANIQEIENSIHEGAMKKDAIPCSGQNQGNCKRDTPANKYDGKRCNRVGVCSNIPDKPPKKDAEGKGVRGENYGDDDVDDSYKARIRGAYSIRY